MGNIFEYDFMLRAFLAAAIIALIAPLIGTTIVLKRLSAIGDATSHSALAGIAFGLVAGVNPIIGAVAFSLFAVLGIEAFRKTFGEYGEIATVVVMSAGIGLAAVLSGFITSGSANLSSLCSAQSCRFQILKCGLHWLWARWLWRSRLCCTRSFFM